MSKISHKNTPYVQGYFSDCGLSLLFIFSFGFFGALLNRCCHFFV